jgi:hypothetical protein
MKLDIGMIFTVIDARNFKPLDTTLEGQQFEVWHGMTNSSLVRVIRTLDGELFTLDNQEMTDHAFGCTYLTRKKADIPAEPDKVKSKAVTSDGGSSSYYDVAIPEWLFELLTQRESGRGQAFIKTEELIEVLFGNDFDFGNIQKSLVRAYGVTQGAGKAGNNLDYELKKIKYSCDKVSTVHSHN